MPHHAERLGILGGEDAELDFATAGELIVEADRFAIDLGGQCRLGQPRADAGGDVARGYWRGEFLGAAIREEDLEHKSRSRKELLLPRRHRYKGCQHAAEGTAAV